MLQIAADAVDAIAALGGLRVTAKEVDGEIELEINPAGEPAADDEIAELGAARVYLDALAADTLADQVVSVEAHGDHFHFTFDPQPV